MACLPHPKVLLLKSLSIQVIPIYNLRLCKTRDIELMLENACKALSATAESHCVSQVCEKLLIWDATLSRGLEMQGLVSGSKGRICFQKKPLAFLMSGPLVVQSWWPHRTPPLSWSCGRHMLVASMKFAQSCKVAEAGMKKASRIRANFTCSLLDAWCVPRAK